MKRFVAVMLAAALALSMLAGCESETRVKSHTTEVHRSEPVEVP